MNASPESKQLKSVKASRERTVSVKEATVKRKRSVTFQSFIKKLKFILLKTRS